MAISTMLFLLSFLLYLSMSWALTLPESSSAPSFQDISSSFTATSRRSLFQKTLGATTTLLLPNIVHAESDPRRTIAINLQKGESLGLQIGDSAVRGKPVVFIQKVVKPNRKLQEGMILNGYDSSLKVIQRIQNGPYPINLEFINLAAGGDAFDDLGSTMVTPKDALSLAQQTENSASSPMPKPSYSITSLSKSNGPCAIQSRRGDVLEIMYEAFYIDADNNKKLYDSSDFRGTGRPYQMVIGSGDMIPGVDQGLYDMCPGEVRRLQIPPILGYGKRARDAFRIPPYYQGLEWKVELVSIDSTIRQDNNNVDRDEREGRALY
jgi:hypothetical protein